MGHELRRVRNRGTGRAAVLLALLMSTMPSAQAADPWPNRPLHLVIPFAPGGTTDLIGRMVAEGLSRAIGRPVVVLDKSQPRIAGEVRPGGRVVDIAFSATERRPSCWSTGPRPRCCATTRARSPRRGESGSRRPSSCSRLDSLYRVRRV